MDESLMKYGNMRMDSRMVQAIGRDARMSSEQGGGWLGDFGGATGYVYWAKRPAAERMTWFAFQAGYSTPEDIAAATDLRTVDVNKALASLAGKGMLVVQDGEVTSG